MLFGRIKQICSQVLDWQPLREQNVCLCVNFSKYPLHISVQSSQFQNKLYDCDGTYKENTLEEQNEENFLKDIAYATRRATLQ